MPSNSWLQTWLLSGVRLSIPLIFAAFGGLLSEKSGVANIALEAYLLASSFAAASTVAVTHSLTLGLFAGLGGALLVGVLFSFFTLKTKADQIIVGMAVNIFMTGFLPVLCKSIFDVSGNTPALEATERISNPWIFPILALGVFIFVQFLFSKTKFGLRVWAAGENPMALRTQGVDVTKVRLQAVLLGAAFASLGGIYLSICAGSGYSRNMSAGRGYMAIAALIFGRWKPLPTFLACLVFGLADALQMLLQSMPLLPGGESLPSQFIQALPYVITLAVLAGAGGRVKAPKAINRID